MPEASAHHLTHSGYRGEFHGRWNSGAARAAVFGMSDGLVSNLSLVAGVAGAAASRESMLIAGAAGLIAGSLSMAAGEFSSMHANRGLLLAELERERQEILDDPAGETLELAGIYERRGLDRAAAMSVAQTMMRDPQIALEAHARDELGLDPAELGSPAAAAGASLIAFAVGACVPLIPLLFLSGTRAIAISLVLGVLVAGVLGARMARLAGRSGWRGAGRQSGLLIAVFSITTALGALVGTAV